MYEPGQTRGTACYGSDVYPDVSGGAELLTSQLRSKPCPGTDLDRKMYAMTITTTGIQSNQLKPVIAARAARESVLKSDCQPVHIKGNTNDTV